MKALGIHMQGGLRWIPKDLQNYRSRYYKAEVKCPECGRRRWITKACWFHYRKQGIKFTGICKACRKATGYKLKKGIWSTKKKKSDFDTFRLIDDKTFLLNIVEMGDYKKIHRGLI